MRARSTSGTTDPVRRVTMIETLMLSWLIAAAVFMMLLVMALSGRR